MHKCRKTHYLLVRQVVSLPNSEIGYLVPIQKAAIAFQAIFVPVTVTGKTKIRASVHAAGTHGRQASLLTIHTNRDHLVSDN